jgi:hypothetical protein
MITGRATHTATLLSDGRVLIAGGFHQEGTAEVAIASAEIYDPATNTFTPTGDMTEAHVGHTATLLPDGQVLIVGGWSTAGRTARAELYDPQAGRFSHVADMAAPRAGFTATLLLTGQVLLAGGESANRRAQRVAEIYDPATRTFATSGSLNTGRAAHTATLLDDRRVLLAGGNSSRGVSANHAPLGLPSQSGAGASQLSRCASAFGGHLSAMTLAGEARRGSGVVGAQRRAMPVRQAH